MRYFVILILFLLGGFIYCGYLNAGGVGEMRKEVESEIKESDRREVFEERLREVVTKRGEPEIAKLLQFTREYPDSKFVEDASLVANFTSFVNLLSDNKINPFSGADRFSECIKDISTVVSQSPSGQFRESTYRKIKEMGAVNRDTKYYAIRIPYKYLGNYLGGMMAVKFGNWQAVIDNFSILKGALNYSRDCKDVFEFDVYPNLAAAYMNLKKKGEAVNIIDEALGKFPDDEKLKQIKQEIEVNKK